MNLVSIAIKNTRRNLFRTLLTVAAVAFAIIAFLLLRTVSAAWLTSVESSPQDRVITRHKLSFFMRLPKRYQDTIANVAGVQGVTAFTWFGGHVPGHEDKFFGNQAVDPRTFLQVYDEVILPPDQRANFLEDRRSAIAGWKLARQFGWKVGDRVMLEGTTFPGLWEFHLAGIYKTSRSSTDPSSFYFHWQYLNDSLRESQRDQASWFCSKVASASAAGPVSKRIDAVFDPHDVQTVSMNEQTMRASFLGMLAALLGAMQVAGITILLIMMLLLGNTVAMGVRERTQEYGVLRALGFRPAHVAAFVLGEAATLGVAGGVLGVSIAIPLINGAVGGYIDMNYAGAFPHFKVPSLDLVGVLVLSVLLAAASAAMPARQAYKLGVVDALRNLG